jgi:hypothetical protein
MKSWMSLGLGLAFSLSFVQSAIAQEKQPDAKPAAAAPQDPAAEAAKKKAEEDKKKADDYDKFVKDLKKQEGEMTFYQKDKQLFLELPEDKLGQIFLAQATWNTGASQGLQAGDPIGSQAIDAFRFDRSESRVMLVKPNSTYRWNPNDPLALSSQRSFPTAILGTFPIAQSNPAKKLVLIDVTNFFFGDVFRLSQMVSFGLFGQYALDRDRSGPDRVRVFPENATVRMNLHYVSQGGGGDNPLAELFGLLGGGGPQLEDSRSAPLKVTFNLWFRKPSDYVPRYADPRVGYFTTDFFNIDQFMVPDRTTRMINRWNLKKKDPKAAMSEPVKPIMWTIDPSIPEKYRPAVRKGVLMWNQAFEKLGYKNAVQVQDAPAGEDYDHADGRFNVIRLTMTEDAAYAIALFRTDPFTGEILNSSVTIDANVLQYGVQEVADLDPISPNPSARALDVLKRDPKLGDVDFYLWASDRDRAKKLYREQATKAGYQCFECNHQHGLRESAAKGYALAQAMGRRINREDYMNQLIQEFVVHEIGHCLGLRHNFVASTLNTTAQLADDARTSQIGLSSSVMDYNPANMVAIIKGGKNFYAPTIGSYDEWAIRYGYTETGAKDPVAERPNLRSIAMMSTRPELAYMTDEDADSFNPLAVRFDMAKDPVNYSKVNIEAAQRLRAWAIKQPMDAGGRRTRLILTSLTRIFREGRLSSRFIGGLVSRRDQSGATLAPVNPGETRAAAMLIANNCFNPATVALPVEVRSQLSQDRNTEASADWTAPLRDLLGTQMQLLFAQTMSAQTLDRIAENQWKWGNNPAAYTTAEHYDLMLGSVFSELNTTGAVDPVRRDLQQFAVSALITQSGAPAIAIPGDARTMANTWLRTLSGSLGKARTGDRMTQVHYRDMKDTIDRFLARKASGL